MKLAGRKAYQYTAIDDCTRFASSTSARAWTSSARSAGRGRSRSTSCSATTLTFALTVQEGGIRLRYTRPRQPQQHGKVERRHRIDTEECWRREAPPNFMTTLPALQAWERRYHFARFSVALKGETPAEMLQRLLPDVRVA